MGHGKTHNPTYMEVDDQLALLERRNLRISDRGAARRAIIREGYYGIVNGYKEPFLDRDASSRAGDDRYRDGTDFQHLLLLYKLDSLLRRHTAGPLLEAETVLKTALVNAFCRQFPEVEAYLDPMCYRTEEVFPGANYSEKMEVLQRSLHKARGNMHKDYVRHYDEKYGAVPLWVAARCLTFGNMSRFFELQTDAVQSRMVENLRESTGRTIGVKRIRAMYGTLPHFRNACSHDERFYCMRVGATRNPDKRISNMLGMLADLLDAGEQSELCSSYLRIVSICDSVCGMSGVRDVLCGAMGVTESSLSLYVVKDS